ncbi:MAG: hypothetical protein K2Y22_05315 [Candidatus Obscuribacterales bacterium]|nr:hypothetical protein [Candidatus Obscuribacterales bacterium]
MIIKPINQELSPGDIVGTAFTTLRRNIGFTCKVLLVPTIFSTLGSMAMQWPLSKPAYWTDSLTGMGSLFLIGIVGLAVGLIAKWVLTLRQMSLMRMEGGFSTDWQESYAAVLQRKWQVIALWILTAIVSVGIFLAWLIPLVLTYKKDQSSDELVPVILLSFGALIVAFSAISFVVLMGLCIIACENLSFKESIDKAVKLTSGNIMRCLGFALAFTLTIVVLTYPLTMPIIILNLWDTYKLGVSHNAGEIPMHTMIVTHVWESFITLLISPLFSFAFAAFYVDLLNRREGLDLRRRLNALVPSEETDNHGT